MLNATTPPPGAQAGPPVTEAGMLAILAQAVEPTINVHPAETSGGTWVAIALAGFAMLGQIAQMVNQTFQARNKLKFDTDNAVKMALLTHKVETQAVEYAELKEEHRVLQVAHAKCEGDHTESMVDRATMRAKLDAQESKIVLLTTRVEHNTHLATTAAKVATETAVVASQVMTKAIEQVPQSTAELVQKIVSDSKHD